MRRLLLGLFLALAAGACGGREPPPEDEVTEPWTAGDDAPLEEGEGAGPDPSEPAQ